MKLEILVAAVDKDLEKLINSMNLRCDAVIINQSNVDDYKEIEYEYGVVKYASMNERGVGRSRNAALSKATGDILLFSDEDIIYDDDAVTKVLNAFESHPEADMLLFNMEVCENRATYHTEKLTRIKWYNSGRYPTYSFAIKRDKLIESGVEFSLLFGGGAKYGCGEDSIFLKNLVDKGTKIYAVPISIGKEQERESTWFKGYNEKFFYDKGVLFHFLYGRMAWLMGIRFVLLKKSFMCKEVSAREAWKLIRQGIKQGIKEDR